MPLLDDEGEPARAHQTNSAMSFDYGGCVRKQPGTGEHITCDCSTAKTDPSECYWWSWYNAPQDETKAIDEIPARREDTEYKRLAMHLFQRVEQQLPSTQRRQVAIPGCGHVKVLGKTNGTDDTAAILDADTTERSGTTALPLRLKDLAQRPVSRLVSRLVSMRTDVA